MSQYSLILLLLTVSSSADYSNTYTISCDEKLNEYIHSSWESVGIEFVNVEQQDVTFTDCDSSITHSLRMYDSTGKEIQDQSVNGCSGWDCYDSSVCPIWSGVGWTEQESFTMKDLVPGTYELAIEKYIDGTDGYWALEVICGPVPSQYIDGVLYHCDSHTDCPGEDTFCDYSNLCEKCAYCDYCADGIDNTCDSCNDSYPRFDGHKDWDNSNNKPAECGSNSSNSTKWNWVTNPYLWLMVGIFVVVFIALSTFRLCIICRHNERMKRIKEQQERVEDRELFDEEMDTGSGS